jgi:hypothetical protein
MSTRQLIQSIVTYPQIFLSPIDTNIIGLENILTQLFQVLGFETAYQINNYSRLYYRGLNDFLRHAIRNPLDFTPNPNQEWIDAAVARGFRVPPPRVSASAYHKKYFSDDEGEMACGICLDKYTSDNNACMVSPCGHVFHCRCIDNWTRSNNANNNKCPTCKEVIGSIETVNVDDLRLSELEMYKDTAVFNFGGRKLLNNEIKYLRLLSR